jgi:predicted choloylglycine hydrolase
MMLMEDVRIEGSFYCMYRAVPTFLKSNGLNLLIIIRHLLRSCAGVVENYTILKKIMIFDMLQPSYIESSTKILLTATKVLEKRAE